MSKSISHDRCLGTLLVLVLLTLPGCGGCDGTSQADMMRAAMRDTGGDDEEDILPSQLARAKLDSPQADAAATKSSRVEDRSAVAGQSDKVPAETESTLKSGDTSTSENPAMAARQASDVSPPTEASKDDTSTENAVPSWQPVTSLEDRREKSIENMRLILAGFNKTIEETKAVPTTAIYDAKGQPLLSWRVAILPHIGYAWLHEQFHLDEPWNSPHNRNLLDLIPECYRDPQADNHLTVYQVPVGTFTAFPNVQKSILVQRIEDGLSDTVLLLEVDREKAVPWTAPNDLEIDARNPKQHLGGLYEDGFFVAWGDQEISCIRTETSNRDVFAMFSIDGGEPLAKTRISRMATAEVGGQQVNQTASIDEPLSSASNRASSPLANDSSDDVNVGKGENSLIPVGMAANWNELAIESLKRKHMRKAFAQKYASLLLEDPKRVSRQFGWSAALERPVLAIRFGIGADINAPPSRSKGVEPIVASPQDMEELKAGYPGEQEVEKVTGELGLRMLSLLRNRQDAGKFGTFAMLGGFENPRRDRRVGADQIASILHYPGIRLIGIGNRRVLTHVAQRNECDVLVVFEIDVKTTRSNQVHNSTKVQIVDAQSGRELLELPELNNIKVEYDRNDRLKDDPVAVWADELKQFLDEQLALAALPELKPDDARARIAAISESPSETPLPSLAEAHLYFGLGLISEYEYREACQAITGKPEASVLVDGTESEKQQFIEQCIPVDGDEL